MPNGSNNSFFSISLNEVGKELEDFLPSGTFAAFIAYVAAVFSVQYSIAVDSDGRVSNFTIVNNFDPTKCRDTHQVLIWLGLAVFTVFVFIASLYPRNPSNPALVILACNCDALTFGPFRDYASRPIGALAHVQLSQLANSSTVDDSVDLRHAQAEAHMPMPTIAQARMMCWLLVNEFGVSPTASVDPLNDDPFNLEEFKAEADNWPSPDIASWQQRLIPIRLRQPSGLFLRSLFAVWAFFGLATTMPWVLGCLTGNNQPAITSAIPVLVVILCSIFETSMQIVEKNEIRAQMAAPDKLFYQLMAHIKFLKRHNKFGMLDLPERKDLAVQTDVLVIVDRHDHQDATPTEPSAF